MWLVLMCVLITGYPDSCTLLYLDFHCFILLRVSCRHNVQMPHTEQVDKDMNFECSVLSHNLRNI